MYVTLVIYQESLHDARSTQYKIMSRIYEETKITKYITGFPFYDIVESWRRCD